MKVLFALYFALIGNSHAQVTQPDKVCILELNSETPKSLASFDLPDLLKTSLIDLTRLRIELTRNSEHASFIDHYSSELQKLKEVFLAQGYTEAFFDETRTFFFHALSLKNETLEKKAEAKTSLVQKQKDDLLHPLRGRTRQIIDAIVDKLQIPEEDVTVEDLVAITKLDLNNKKITELREGDFQGLINLEELYLGFNQLKWLPETVFQGLEALKWLSLSFNQLAGLPQNVFRGLGALRGLLLNDNQLTDLPQNVFRDLRTLVQLYLYNNKLTGLPQTVFQGLGALENLYAHNNQLEWLPENVFRGLGALRRLNLSENPIAKISKSFFSVQGLNQHFIISMKNLLLDKSTKEMLREKYRGRIEGIY